MSCNIDATFRREFPNPPVYAMFASTVLKAGDDPATQIGNTDDGYIDEFDLAGNAYATPGSHTMNDPATGVYSTLLRPVSDLRMIYGAQRLFLEKIEFYGYDSTLSGSANQDAATIAAIIASKATDDAYAQSLYRNSLMMHWQPNWFRPEFKIDDKPVIGGFQSTNYAAYANKGDMSIGFPLPYCFDIFADFEKIKEISVHAQLVQYIAATGLYQRYPLVCIATFWIGPNRRKPND